jgi:hypothetical protein
MNLILALFWLIVAISLFLYPLLNPAGGQMELGNTGISFAWVAVFFFCFNILRWWSVRLGKKAREEIKKVPERRREEYNPEFNFEDKG